MQSVIKLEHVTKNFYVNNCDTIFDYLKGKKFRKKKNVVAVRNVSFDIQKGEDVGFVGVNGAGKSTLIKMMTGILMPSEGKITVLGNDPFYKRNINNYKIGAVFGQRCQLRWDLSPLESYRLFQAIYKIPEQQYQEQLAQMVEVLEIDEILSQPVRTLSLGQKMRAELAGAILHRPQILFLDEPTLGLDVLSKQAIIRFLLQCKEKRDTTIIFTSHDIEDVGKLCDRLIIMKRGQKFLDDQIDNLHAYTRVGQTLSFTSAGRQDFVLSQELEQYTYTKKSGQICFMNVAEEHVADVVGRMFAENELSGVDISKPEFTDVFIDLLQEERINDSGNTNI